MSFVWKVHAGYEESVGTARHNILLFNLAAASYVYVQKSYILNLIHFEDHNIYYTGKSLGLIFLRKVFFLLEIGAELFGQLRRLLNTYRY